MKQIIYLFLICVPYTLFSLDTLERWNGQQYQIFSDAVKFKPKNNFKDLNKNEIKLVFINIPDSIYSRLESLSIDNCIYDSELNFKLWNSNYSKLSKKAWSKYCHRFIVLMRLDILNTTHTKLPFDIDYNKTMTESIPEIENHLSKLKFKSYGTYNDTLGKVYVFCNNINSSDSTKAEFVYKLYFNNNGTKGISFQSTNYNDYLRFKMALTQSGFKATKFAKENNSLHEYYINSNYKANIWVLKKPTIYEMSIDIPK